MPSTQCTRSVRAALMNIVCASKIQAAMTGSKTLSCNCPASAPIETVRSLPITRKQTMFTTSGITGLTLPGMIDEPGCFGGRLISRRPVRGPAEMFGALPRVAGRRVEPGPDRRGAHVDLAEDVMHRLEGADLAGQRLAKR